MTTNKLAGLMSDKGRVALIGTLVDEVEALDSEIQRWVDGVVGPALKDGTPSRSYLSPAGISLLTKRRNQLATEARSMTKLVRSVQTRNNILRELGD